MTTVLGVNGNEQRCIHNVTVQLFKQNLYKNIFLTVITFGLYYYFGLCKTAKLLVGRVQDLGNVLLAIEKIQEENLPSTVSNKKEAMDFIIQKIREKNESKYLNISDLSNAFFYDLMKMKNIRVPNSLQYCQDTDKFIENGSKNKEYHHNDGVRNTMFIDLVSEILKIKKESVEIDVGDLNGAFKIYSVKELQAVMKLVVDQEATWTPAVIKRVSFLLNENYRCPKKTWDEVMLPWENQVKKAFFSAVIEKTFDAFNDKMKKEEIFSSVYKELALEKGQSVWYEAPSLDRLQKYYKGGLQNFSRYDSTKKNGAIPVSTLMFENNFKWEPLILVDSNGKKTNVSGLGGVEKSLRLMNWLAREGEKEKTHDLIQNLQETLVQKFSNQMSAVIYQNTRDAPEWRITPVGLNRKIALFRIGEGLFFQRIDVEMDVIVNNSRGNLWGEFSKCLRTRWYVDHIKNPKTGVWEIKNIRSDPITVSF